MIAEERQDDREEHGKDAFCEEEENKSEDYCEQRQTNHHEPFLFVLDNTFFMALLTLLARLFFLNICHGDILLAEISCFLKNRL